MTQDIKPERITKPIQLLGAWLTGLLAIDSCFLIAAGNLPIDSWQALSLTVAAILNVPIFLAAVFLLQTRFRPELQEDSYYSSYINQKTNTTIQIDKSQAALLGIEQRLERLELTKVALEQAPQRSIEAPNFATLLFSVNHYLSDAEAIVQELAKSGVSDIREFGSSSPPLERVVAISPNLNASDRRAILSFATKLGFRRYSTIEPFEEIEEDVLFGAYGDAKNIRLLPRA